jgi:hypothetical protein
MSVRNGISLLLAVSALTLLAGCGGSNSPKAIAPPSGGFSASSLSGTYVFSTTGSDSSGQNAAIVLTGAFAANGTGGITGGSIDIEDGSVGVQPAQPITGGSYTVTVDGRGLATLNSASGNFTLDFVLTSKTHGLVTEFDTFGSGSGVLDLQPATVSQTSITGLTFGLTGVGSSASFATAGTVTLDASGTVTAGFEDFNNGGSATINQAVPTTSFITVGTGTTPGTANLVGPFGTLVFDVYAIDSTHLKLVETDGLFITSGDAYTPGTALPVSSTLVFSMSGFDSGNFPLALAGTIPFDANSAIAAGGVEAYNDDGAYAQQTAITGGFTAIAGGRSTLTLTGFSNGAANGVASTYTFAAYPFTSNGVSGVQLVEIDNASTIGFNGVTVGTGFVQTSTSIAASQGFGMNLSAINTSSEEDDIAEFTTTSAGFTGIVDVNDQGSTTFKQALNGSYAAPSGGVSLFTSNFFNGNFYVVNGSTMLVLETDNNQIGTGIAEQQNGSGIPGAAQSSSIAVLHAVSPHGALRRKQ